MSRRAPTTAPLAGLRRPQPPAAALELAPEVFVPAPDVWTWAFDAFVADGAPLLNEEHRHLRQAHVGVLWTNVPNSRQMRGILATAEQPSVTGGAWKRGRFEQQLREWFGAVPDFLVTIYARAAVNLDDASWCALVEHELLHCAQARTAYGAPRFSRATGKPIFAIRGHDAEEFTAIVRRYGTGAAADGVAELVRAAAKVPEIGRAAIAGACGTCLRVAA